MRLVSTWCMFLVVLAPFRGSAHARKSVRYSKLSVKGKPLKNVEIAAEGDVERILAALEDSDDLSDSLLEDEASYFDSSYESYLDGLHSYAGLDEVPKDWGASRKKETAKERVVQPTASKKGIASHKISDKPSKTANKVPVKATPAQRPATKERAKTNAGFMSITTPWIRRFLAQHSKDVLLPVPKEWWADNFNLAHLAPVIEKYAADLECTEDNTVSGDKPYHIYRQALQLIIQEAPLPAKIPERVQKAAIALYLLVHQRYVLSPRGLDIVRRRFLIKKPQVDPIFGRCPRALCTGAPLLPLGRSSNISTEDSIENRAKRYCPSCGESFHHWSSNVDGCAWGNSFCFLFLMVHGEALLGRQPKSPGSLTVVPGIFGFKIHSSAYAP